MVRISILHPFSNQLTRKSSCDHDKLFDKFGMTRLKATPFAATGRRIDELAGYRSHNDRPSSFPGRVPVKTRHGASPPPAIS